MKLSTSLYNQAYKDKDKGGIARKGVIDWKKLCGDKGTPNMWKPEGDAVYKGNIIPYVVKSKLHPLVKAGNLNIGDLDFELDVWVHTRMGPNQDVDVLCPKRNYGRPCPICEESSRLYDAGKKTEGKKLLPTRRIFVNWQLIDHGEPKDLMVFDVSHYLFMKELLEEAHACANGKDITPFADIESGSLIKFRTEEEKLGETGKMIKFKSFSFLARDLPLKDDIIKEAISFDDGLVLHTYEEIEKIMYGQDEEESTGKAPSPAPAPSAPEPAAKTESKQEPKKPDPAPASTDKPGRECPSGHVFGKDVDKFPKDCKNCKIWDDCIAG